MWRPSFAGLSSSIMTQTVYQAPATRLEGEGVTLTTLDTGEMNTHRSASFGQYVFEGLAPGQYSLSVHIGWERIETSLHVPPGGRFQRVDIALSPELFRQPDRGPSHKRQFAMLE